MVFWVRRLLCCICGYGRGDKLDSGFRSIFVCCFDFDVYWGAVFRVYLLFVNLGF